MKTSWFKTMAAAAMTALTFGFAPKAEAADPVKYRYPVYNDPSDPAKGIKEWKEGTVTEYTVVDTSSTTWGTAEQETWYVVSSSKTFSNRQRITCIGDVHLILANGVKLTANAGITASPQTSGYSSFTVYAQSEGASMGELHSAAAGTQAAGIGGFNGDGSNITINGGKVTATGGERGAGIGGAGQGGAGYNITINGGTVTAIGSSGGGAGIGGCWGTTRGGDGSYITINGGTVVAYPLGRSGDAGIGGGGCNNGGRGGDGSYITINGGTVEASGFSRTSSMSSSGKGAGIGGGDKSSTSPGASFVSGAGSNIKINGGTVTAMGGSLGGSIGIGGGGTYGSASDIYVSTALLLKADDGNPPTTVIPNDGGDLATALDKKKYATIVPTYAITMDLGIEHGTVAADATRTNESETVTLTLTPHEGYAYEDGSLTITKDGGGTVDPTEVTAGEKYTFVMPGTNVTVTATFAAQSQTITIPTPEHGTVTTSPKGSAKTDETVEIMVNPESGYELKDLKVYKTGEPSTEVEVTGSKFTMPPYGVTVSATFAASSHTITIPTPEHGTVTTSPDGSAKTDETVTITVTPDEGYELGPLSVKGATTTPELTTVEEGKAYTFTMPAEAVTVSATFRELLAITSVTAQQRYPWNGKVDITYTVKGEAKGGETLTVTATNTVDGTVYTATSAALIGTPDFTPGTHALVWDLDAQGLRFKASSIRFGVAVGGGMQNLMADGKLEVRKGCWNGDGMRSNGMINTDDSSTTSVFNSVLYTWYTGAANSLCELMNGLFKLAPNSVYVYTFVDPDPATTAWTTKSGFLQADARVFTNFEKQEAATVMVGTTTKSEAAIAADYDKNKQWATTGWNTSSKQKAGFDGVAWYDKTTKRSVMIFTTGNEDSYLGLDFRMNGGSGFATASDGIRAAATQSILNGELYRVGDSDGTKTAQALREAGIADVLTSDESAGSAGELFKVYSDEVAVDTLGSPREAAASETIRFSPVWETEEDGATAVVTIDGVEASKSAETGAYVWTPKPKLGGLVEMTHQVFIDGVQTGATLTASFTVPEPPVAYRYPVYETPGEPASGIASWEAGETNATLVLASADAVTWGEAGTTSWYVVATSGVAMGDGVTCQGDVRLILCPGAWLEVTNGVTVANGGAFTVYGQPDGAGALWATGKGGAAIAGSRVTLNGGTFAVSGGTGAFIGGTGASGNWVSPEAKVVFDLVGVFGLPGGQPLPFEYAAIVTPDEMSADRVLMTGVASWTGAQTFTLVKGESLALAKPLTVGDAEGTPFADAVLKLAVADGALTLTAEALPEEPIVKDKDGHDVTVVVPDEWRVANDVSDEDAVDTKNPNVNGMPTWQNYVLGLDPKNIYSGIYADSPQNENANTVTIETKNLDEQKLVPGYSVKYRLDTKLRGESEYKKGVNQNDADFDVSITGEDPTGVYKVNAVIFSNDVEIVQSAEAINIVGMLKQTQALTNAIISVPWSRLAPGLQEDIKVTDVVKTATLDEGDELRVYRPGSSTYESWTLNADKQWVAANTFQVSAVGMGALKETSASNDATIPRGSGIWLCRKAANAGKPYYLYGQAEGEVSAVLTQGPNLVGATGLGEYDFNEHLTGARSGDAVMIPSEGAVPLRYEFREGAWGRWTTGEAKTVKDRYGNVTTTYPTVWKTDDATVKPGTGFWLHNNSGKITVK